MNFHCDYTLGRNVRIDDFIHCSTNVFIGDYVHISPFVSIIGGVNTHFEAWGFNNIMAGARIICASDKFDDSGLHGSLIPPDLKGDSISAPVIMEHFANIGTNAVVMPGARLRRGVLLTVGSVLYGDTKEWGVYDGNPAKLLYLRSGEKRIECAKKLGYDL